MNETAIILGLIGFVFGSVGLVMGCISVSMVCGFLRSTHTIQWKPLETADPFSEEEEETFNTAAIKLKQKPKTDYNFMEDVADQNNF